MVAVVAAPALSGTSPAPNYSVYGGSGGREAAIYYYNNWCCYCAVSAKCGASSGIAVPGRSFLLVIGVITLGDGSSIFSIDLDDYLRIVLGSSALELRAEEFCIAPPPVSVEFAPLFPLPWL